MRQICITKYFIHKCIKVLLIKLKRDRKFKINFLSLFMDFSRDIEVGLSLNYLLSLAFNTRKKFPPKILSISFSLYPLSTNAFVING